MNKSHEKFLAPTLHVRDEKRFLIVGERIRWAVREVVWMTPWNLQTCGKPVEIPKNAKCQNCRFYHHVEDVETQCTNTDIDVRSLFDKSICPEWKPENTGHWL